MREQSAVVLETGHRVQRFLDANASVLAVVNGSDARKTLDAAVAALEAHANELEAKKQAGQSETKKQRALRRALQKLMRPINRIGQETLSSSPDIALLRMPPVEASTQVLIEHAYAMAQAAAPHAAVFVSNGLPADFLARLTAATDAIVASLGDRNDAGAARVVATGGTVQDATRIRRAITVMDSVVKFELADNDVLLLGWTSARRYHASRTVTAPATAATHPSTPSAAGTTPGSTPAGTTLPAPSTPATPAQEVTKPVA